MKDSTVSSAMKFETINPATEEVINQYEIMTKDQINNKVKKSKIAFQEWKKDVNKRMDSLSYPHMSENADFSPQTIKNAIKEEEEKTNEIIKNKPFY